MRTLALGDAPVGLDAFLDAAAGPVVLTVTEAARGRLAAARAVVEAHAAGPAPVYGLNTGLGGNLAHRLAPEEIPAFQAQMLAGRTVGVGDPLPEPHCRALLLARIVSMARGVSGVSPAVLDLMIALAARGMAPAVASRGSIGAADLAMGAEMGAALIGRGLIWVDGARRPAAEALAAAGLASATLGPKDALALANSSAGGVALSAVGLGRARRLMRLAMGAAALSAEGYGANPTIFDARLNALRPAPGQAAAAAWFRAALSGSSLHDGARSVQDALSFRAMAPIFGAAQAALDHAAAVWDVEANAGADSPAVLAETGEMLSTPNFHTPALALALDALAIAVVHVATASAQRVVKLMAPQLSGLPKYLSPVGGASAGFVPMQKTVAALLSEIRLKAAPASLDAMVVSDMVEDAAPNTPLCARKLDEQAALWRLLIGIEALVAAQAVDLRAPARLGPVAATLHGAIRRAVPPLAEDRATGPEVEAALAALETAAVDAALGLTG